MGSCFGKITIENTCFGVLKLIKTLERLQNVEKKIWYYVDIVIIQMRSTRYIVPEITKPFTTYFRIVKGGATTIRVKYYDSRLK